MRAFAIVCAAVRLSIGAAHAQDPFEIHVYEYETLRRGGFTFETHLNHIGKGTRTSDGLAAPSQDQFHMAFELTAGLADFASIGCMQLNARRPASGLEYAGWRVLPHLYAPHSWRLSLDVGLVAEFSFQKTTYEENSQRLEIRPILREAHRESSGRLQPSLRKSPARAGRQRRLELRTRGPGRL
jgi:hypothetical protein